MTRQAEDMVKLSARSAEFNSKSSCDVESQLSTFGKTHGNMIFAQVRRV